MDPFLHNASCCTLQDEARIGRMLPHLIYLSYCSIFINTATEKLILTFSPQNLIHMALSTVPPFFVYPHTEYCSHMELLATYGHFQVLQQSSSTRIHVAWGGGVRAGQGRRSLSILRPVLQVNMKQGLLGSAHLSPRWC